MPNLYATISYSPTLLGAYPAFQQALAKGAFNTRAREAIFLAVSEVNGCVYCLAAHPAMGKLNGFSEDETRQLRAGTHADPKLGVLARLAAAITQTHAPPAEQLLTDFFALGYANGALIDLIALVADQTLANYVHNITQVPVDFPAAPELAAHPA